MAAAAVAPMQQQQQQSQSGSNASNAFSPLTMFECTISSATMLIDSMAVKDLLMAFRIVAQLHGHLLDVLDPNVQQLSHVAEQHARCTAAHSWSTGVSVSTPGTSKASECGIGGSLHQQHQQQQLVLVKSESMNNNNNNNNTTNASSNTNCDEDCVLMDADAAFDTSGVHHPFSFGTVRQQHQQQQHHHTGNSSSSSESDLSNEWKAVLRSAYRALKDETGTDVFDFSLPYSASCNVSAAGKVIDKALQLSARKPDNLLQWRTRANIYVHRWYRCNLKPTAKRAEKQLRMSLALGKHNYQSAKLNRRQRSYEALKPQLDHIERVKFESVVLTREYTSSDEEDGDAAAGDGTDSALRVRTLAWESQQLRSMKDRLDSVFAQQLADPEQLALMHRLQRDPDYKSDRPVPIDGNFWARNA